jgi:YesN/AraC family two-component response regulator
VDDDPTFKGEFKECFPEYNFLDAASAEEAFRILQNPHEVDIVILDVRMDGMSGLDALGKIKDISPESGIVVVTGHGSKDVVLRALRGMADNYIEKPFDIEATREIIENLLEKRRAGGNCGDDDLEGKIAHVKRFVQRNYLRKIGLADACHVASLSPKYLSRIFKEQTGMHFSEYKLALKLERAKTLLESTGYTVAQISDKLGYNNTESFIRLFKKRARVTPSHYRKTHAKRRSGKPRK